jgi:hypothetical protein
MSDQENNNGINTVTNETLDAFHAEQLGLGGDEEAPESIEEEAVEPEIEESQEEAPIEEPEEAPKQEPEAKKGKKNGVQERISELVEERNTERQKREALEARLAALEKKEAPIPELDQEALKKPRMDDYSDVSLYEKDMLAYTREMLKAEQRAEHIARQQATIEQSWNQKLEASRSEHADWDEVVNSSTVQIHEAVKEAIAESDIGPELIYHLAVNPEVAEGLKRMSIASQVREIGRLEAKLAKTEAQPVKTTVSKAPQPITPIRAAASLTDNKMDADGEFHGTPEEWKALRKAGKIK